jgi:hypothetical protein
MQDTARISLCARQRNGGTFEREIFDWPEFVLLRILGHDGAASAEWSNRS